jgi:hypothetical protein
MADGLAEHEAASLMVCNQWQRVPWCHRTVGTDKGYDTFDFVDLMRELGTSPDVTRGGATGKP